jgi:hypothetical protein
LCCLVACLDDWCCDFHYTLMLACHFSFKRWVASLRQ